MSSPRKVVPLSGGPSHRPRTYSSPAQPQSSRTRRAFFCSVVFEGGHHGRALHPDVEDIISSLGVQLSPDGKPIEVESEDPTDNSEPAERGPLSIGAPNDPSRRKRALTDASTLADLLNELIVTERSYVRRIIALKQSYADPLRSFARTKDTAIIPAYEAKTLFGNIDSLVPANEAFLMDLERMIAPKDAKVVGGIGDVALKHFKELKTFDCYKQYYSKREEAQSIFEREMMKKSSTGFAGFIDRIKYSTADTKNRVGLRELLMDPVQRIPRYTLLFRTMIKHMPESDPQRAKLIEAEEAATKIAQCETDDPTKRAAIMYCLERSIDGFPPGLISSGRKFIDCIDVDDVPTELNGLPPSSSYSSNAPPSLPCTLFLFDDRLMIVKRHSSSSSGRALTGLEDIDKVAKAGILGGSVLGIKRSGLTCKGVVDITDLVAADPGGSDIHMFLEKEPADQSDRWSNRPFRSLSVVHPPATGAQVPMLVSEDKTRFLENLWLAQAMYRAKSGRSVPFVSEEKDVGSNQRRMTIARTYFNVYQRTAYLSEPRKGKIVLHIDPTGSSDPLPFGVGCGPFVIVRAQPMAGELCRYAVTSSDESDEGEEDIVHTSTVAARIVQTIHQCGLFKFQTSRASRPTTPTASTRGRAALFNLDAISRNLFNTKSGSASARGISGADFFGGAESGSHRRGRSTSSRSSAIQTQSTGTTLDNSFKFSQRSTSTAATSLVDEDSFGQRSRDSSPRKLSKRSSPVDVPNVSPPRARTSSRNRKSVPVYGGVDTFRTKSLDEDESEWDLSMRLELARQNSLSQQITGDVLIRRSERPEEDPIDEEDASTIRRATSPKSIDRPSSPASTFRPPSTTPTQLLEIPSRPSSAMSNRRQPMGPRDAPKSPSIRPTDLETEVNMAFNHLDHTVSPVVPRTPSPPLLSRRSSQFRRLPLVPLEQAPPNFPTPHSAVEPLSIKKKNSVRQSSPPSPRKPGGSPVSRNHSIASRREMETNRAAGKRKNVSLMTMAQATLEDMNSSYRAVKRIKLEVETIRTTPHDDDETDRLHSGRSAHTGPFIRSPQTRSLVTREAEARMEEMRQLIGKGRGGQLPRSTSPIRGSQRGSNPDLDRLKELVYDAERDLQHAVDKHAAMQNELQSMESDSEANAELEKVRGELHHVKRQCDLVKKLLGDATAENEIMYDAFNEELDGMFQDANLPPTEAWNAMTADLRKAKNERNALSKEISSLKRSLELAQLQNEEWGALLRSHGLIS